MTGHPVCTRKTAIMITLLSPGKTESITIGTWEQKTMEKANPDSVEKEQQFGKEQEMLCWEILCNLLREILCQPGWAGSVPVFRNQQAFLSKGRRLCSSFVLSCDSGPRCYSILYNTHFLYFPFYKLIFTSLWGFVMTLHFRCGKGTICPEAPTQHRLINYS